MVCKLILLIDNYDSFVYNLSRYFAELGQPTRVVRNDALPLKEMLAIPADAVVLSPGPGTPDAAGLLVPYLQQLPRAMPVLGVCLGHQAMTCATGGVLQRAPEPVHGRTSPVMHDETGLFAGLETPLQVTRYHSLIVDESTLPSCWEVTARTVDGLIMAMQHRKRPWHGVQFHPEAVLTQGGHRLLRNFLGLCGLKATSIPEPDFAVKQTDPDWYEQPVERDCPTPQWLEPFQNRG